MYFLNLESITMSSPSGLRSGLTIDWSEIKVAMSYSNEWLIPILILAVETW